MKKFSLVLITLFFFLFFATLASMNGIGGIAEAKKIEKPVWVEKGKTSRYPEQFYLIGIGLTTSSENPEEDRSRADNNARSELAKQIQVSVEQQITDMEQEIIKTGKRGWVSTEQVSQMKVESSSSVNLTLRGLAIAERWFGPREKIHYSLAVLNRSETASRLRTEIKNLKKAAQTLISYGQGYEGKGDYILALKSYLKAIGELIKASTQQIILEVVREETNAGHPAELGDLSTTELESTVERIITNLKIHPHRGDSQKGEPEKSLPEPLVARVTYDDGVKQVPIKNASVHFSFKKGKGSLEPSAKTDTVGLASAKVYKVESTGEAINTVAASINPEGMITKDEVIAGSKWWTELGKIETVFTYQLLTKTAMRIVVKVFEDNLGAPMTNSFVENEVVKRLVESGFTVVDQNAVRAKMSLTQLKTATDEDLVSRLGSIADLIVVGKASSQFSSKMADNFIFCRARGAIRALRTDTGRVIASVDIESKGPGNTKEKAGKKSLQSLSGKVAEELVKKIEEGLK
ncbi:MAG: LPP20 family lipoprotein [Deltaproteobacteria bacterium]|nr:MAG: LPP20 family lipoprotein [Deltaproteobacteria bacterium]